MVYQILENLWDNNITIARLDSNSNSYILIYVYIPPNRGHDMKMNDILNKILIINIDILVVKW